MPLVSIGTAPRHMLPAGGLGLAHPETASNASTLDTPTTRPPRAPPIALDTAHRPPRRWVVVKTLAHSTATTYPAAR